MHARQRACQGDSAAALDAVGKGLSHSNAIPVDHPSSGKRRRAERPVAAMGQVTMDVLKTRANSETSSLQGGKLCGRERSTTAVDGRGRSSLASFSIGSVSRDRPPADTRSLKLCYRRQLFERTSEPRSYCSLPCEVMRKQLQTQVQLSGLD